jgi:hypothetical protein
MRNVGVGFTEIVSLLVALLLAACASTGPTSAQNETMRIQTLAVDAMKQVLACRKPIDENPRYARIYQNFGVGARVFPNASQLANKTTMSDDDVGIGFDWYAEILRCDTEQAQLMGRIDPELGVMTVGFIRESTAIVDEVVRTQPRQTIGSINAKILDFKNRQKAAALEWARKTNERLKAQHEEELAARQASAEVAQQAADQALDLLMTGLQLLGQRQTLIANAQQQYMLAHASYRPERHVTPIKCQMVARKLSCKN